MKLGEAASQRGALQLSLAALQLAAGAAWKESFANSLASFSFACLMVSFGEAASKRSFQPSASNLAAYRLQLSMCSGQLG